MKKSIYRKVMASLLLLMILVSCSMKSEDGAVTEAKEAAENSFQSTETLEANKELEHTSFYLPERFHIESEETSNIILKDGEQTYIVFNNSLEPASSELGADSYQNLESLLFDTFKDDDKFGYILIMPETDKKYEMAIGIGGAKITTYTTRHDMAKDAEDLMLMSRSLVERNADGTE